jgi:hypothetical protein
MASPLVIAVTVPDSRFRALSFMSSLLVAAAG